MMERLVSANASTSEKMEQSQRAVLALSEASTQTGVNINFVKVGFKELLLLHHPES